MTGRGRTIEEARRRLQQEAAERRPPVDLSTAPETIELPGQVEHLLEQSRKTREHAENVRVEARSVTLRAVDVLTRTLGLSTRDAAQLLGLSHQRVAQLSSALEPPSPVQRRASRRRA